MLPRILLVTISIFAALAVTEIAVRLLPIGPIEIPLSRQKYQLSEIPGISYQCSPGFEDDHGLTFNEYGWRSPSLSKEKADGTFRIAFIGDSVTHGVGVDRAETFPQLVTTLLQEHCAGDEVKKFEFINAAVSGYNLQDIAATFEHLVLGFDPDLVIYTYCANDPQQFSIERERLLDAVDNKDQRRGLMERSRLWRILSAGRSAPEPEDPQFAPWGEGQDHYYVRIHRDPNQWTPARQALKKIQELCALNDIPLRGYLSPILYDITDDNRYQLSSLEEFLAKQFAELDIEFHNLRPCLAEVERRHGDVLPIRWGTARDGLHFNARGHGAVAAEMLTPLLDQFPALHETDSLKASLERYRAGLLPDGSAPVVTEE